MNDKWIMNPIVSTLWTWDDLHHLLHWPSWTIYLIHMKLVHAQQAWKITMHKMNYRYQITDSIKTSATYGTVVVLISVSQALHPYISRVTKNYPGPFICEVLLAAFEWLLLNGIKINIVQIVQLSPPWCHFTANISKLGNAQKLPWIHQCKSKGVIKRQFFHWSVQ